MLGKLFTSKTRVKILGLLLFSPKNEFHLRGIAKRIDISPPHVRKELENLEEINLIKKRPEGNMILFRVNKDSPIYEELKRMFLKTEYLGDFLRDSLSRMEDMKYALIYGSFAKGEERGSSDIDLLLIGPVKEEHLLKMIRKVESEINRDVNYVLWTENEFRKRAREGNSLLANIIKNPVIMIMGVESEFRKDVKG
jgi:predicted nucleotidyltransferase